MLLRRWKVGFCATAGVACGAFVLLVAHCGGDLGGGYAERPVEAGRDARMVDSASRDTSLPGADPWDAAAMIGFDAGGVDPFASGTWVPAPDPLYCPLRVAADPANAGLNWTWGDCAPARADCKSLVVDWPLVPNARAIGYLAGNSVHMVGGKPYFAYWRWYSTASTWPPFPPAAVWTVQELYGAPVFAIGGFEPENDWCSPIVSVSELGVGYVALIRQHGLSFAWARWSNLNALSSVVLKVSDLGIGGPQEYSLGAEQMFIGAYPAGISLFDVNTASLSAVRNGDGGVVSGERPIAVPGGAVALTADGLIFVHADGRAAVIVRPDAGRMVSFFAIDASSHDIVWVESERMNFDYINPILWTSPLGDTPAGIERRKVTRYTDTLSRGGSGLMANGGFATLVVGGANALVVRLSDGQGWLVDARPTPVGMPIETLWIDTNELWVLTSPSAYLSQAGGIIRLSRTSFGAPSIPQMP